MDSIHPSHTKDNQAIYEPIESVLRRDRAIVIAGLVGIAALSWIYVFYLAWGMNKMGMKMQMVMPQMQTWGVPDLFLTFVMWSVMMVAMMVPSASPMILMFTNINRKRSEYKNPLLPTGMFLLGYLVIWTGFSLLATLVQWELHTAALLSPSMVNTSPILGGALLLAAGVFQWTPLKHACLGHCRTPLGFLLNEWQDGKRGALVMGLRHGSFCLGCCWLLMALLFVVGIMNLLWVAAIAGFVLLEKVARGGEWLGRVAGLLLIGGGIWMLAQAL